MTVKNHYQNIQSALLRHANLMAARLGPEYQAVNLDAFVDESLWPTDKHMIGVSDLNLDIDEFYTGSVVFAVGLTRDKNLLKTGEVVGKVLDTLLPDARITVHDTTTLSQIGSLIVLRGVRVGSPLNTKSRPVMPVLVSFASDLRVK